MRSRCFPGRSLSLILTCYQYSSSVRAALMPRDNIRTAVQGVVNKNGALEAGKSNPLDTIKMGLRARKQED